MTEESTPEITSAEDTSAVVETSDTVDTSATPEISSNEPETEINKADETEKETEPKLLAGKYKTVDDLEKAYKESEKFVNKAREYEKQLQAYHEAEEQARQQREIAARSQGFNDASEQEFRFDVKNHEFLRYVQAMESSLSGEAYNRAYQALSKYQNTGNPQDLAMAQACFSPAVISEIARDTARYESERSVTYQEEVRNRHFAEVKNTLETFARETDGWLDSKERQDIIGLAVNLTGGNIDLPRVKELVDAVEKSAIERYKNEQKAIAENKAVQNSLQAPEGNGTVINGEKWLTREEYNALTPEQESKQYDKIIRQIELEKSGKLPRMLT